MKSLVRGCYNCGCLLLLTLALVLAILIALIALVQRAAAQTPEPQIVPLVPLLEAHPSRGPLPRTFYEADVRVSYCGGRVWLAGAPDLRPYPLRTDDELVLSIIEEGGTVATRKLVLNFQSPDHSRIIARSGPVEITPLFSPIWGETRLRVQLVDRTPPEYSSGPYWLILEERCVPTPTPTARAWVTPTTTAAPASPMPPTVTSQPATPILATPTLAPPTPTSGLRPIDSEAKSPSSTDAPGLGPVAAALVGAALIAGGIAWVALGGRPSSPEPLNLYQFGILDLFDRETLEARAELLNRYPQGVTIVRHPLGLVALTAAVPQNAIARIRPSAEGAVLEVIPPDAPPVSLEPGRPYSLAGGQVELYYRNALQKRGGQR